MRIILNIATDATDSDVDLMSRAGKLIRAKALAGEYTDKDYTGICFRMSGESTDIDIGVKINKSSISVWPPQRIPKSVMGSD